jgi:hypothetical protein
MFKVGSAAIRPLAQQVAVIALQRGKKPRDARRARFLSKQVPQVLLEVCIGGRRQRLPVLLFQPGGELDQVAAIGVEGVSREPILEPEGVAEFIDQSRALVSHHRQSDCLSPARR